MSKKIRVLCVDDSALIRDILTTIINSYDDMEVVAVAPDPLVARDLIKQHNPDVLTLDVEMPKMDGLDFLERLMRLRPMPVLMISSLTQKGSETTLKALELGAIDYIAKPDVGIRSAMAEYSSMIADKIRIAARATPRQILASPAQTTSAIKQPIFTSEKLVIIGASTGGTEAIRYILERMPPNSPAILITQHMPIGFTKSFAERLDKLCAITVKEAEHGERIIPGHAYIAPGNIHMKVMKSGANYVIALEDSEPVNRHRPSCDVLFQSASVNVGKNAVGVILTGMGKDGAHGLLAMKEAGAYTLAQNEETCVVFGMPKEAIALDAAIEVVSLQEMSEKVISKLIASGLARRI